eukprot:3731754-Prymnesium_polylepis.1
MQCGVITVHDRPCPHVLSAMTSNTPLAIADGNAYTMGRRKTTCGTVQASASAVGAARSPPISAPTKHCPKPLPQSRRVARGTAISVQAPASARQGRTSLERVVEGAPMGSAANATPSVQPQRSATAALLETSHHFSSTTSRRGA